MGVQRWVRRPVVSDLPGDFPERLALFKEASGLSWRALACMLGVRPYRIRQWRKGCAAPSSAHLFALLTLAERMGLRDGVLMCSDRDLPEASEIEASRHRTSQRASA